MAKKAPLRRSATLARQTSESRPILALLLALAGSYLLVAMVFRSADQPWLFQSALEPVLGIPAVDAADATRSSNPCGGFGALLATLGFVAFGLAAFLAPLSLLVAAWFALNRRAHTLWPAKVLLMLGSLFLFAALMHLFLGAESAAANESMTAYDPKGPGGRVGLFLMAYPLEPLGTLGAWIFLVPAYGFCLLGILADDPKATLAAWLAEMRDSFLHWNTRRAELARQRAEAARRDAAARAEAQRLAAAVRGAAVLTAPAPLPIEPEPAPAPAAPAAAPAIETVDPLDVEVGNPDQPDDEDEEAPAEGLSGVLPDKPAKAPRLKADPDPKPQISGKIGVTKGERIERAPASLIPKRRGDYIFPTLDLLTAASAKEAAREDYRRRAGELIQTLKEFKVDVVPVDPAAGIDVGIQQGPSITRYEIRPAPGVRIERIANLQNNIAMNLMAESVRILAPVPGKGTVGIEIPNTARQIVVARDILESKAWVEFAGDLPVVLGVDSVTNRPIVQDLSKMPHALIAGSTGQGKSVCINTLLVSLLYRMTPEDLRLILVDPKVVELQVYNELPHLLVPVVTDPKKVPAALKWLISEMERRYRIFAATNVRNLAGFNARVAKDAAEAEKARQQELELTPEERAAAAQAAAEAVPGEIEIPKEKLPCVVCVIDEMADLMMVAAKDIETSVARIAQKARAAGIHLVLATQRPSTDVITGLIKANLPTRIAFKVAALVDSRTILDAKGAETLVGKGDMLYLAPGTATLQRVQGAFISDEDVTRIVAFLREKNGAPEFVAAVQDALDRADDDGDAGDGGEGGGGPEDDPMAAKAWEIIRSSKKASVSFLQRRLSIGYGRAARIIDILEEQGYIGPDNGPGSPREILRDD
ncbi:MAG: DNA translocase FtsK 4TM domain-containing protein [Opitutia bacterium]